METKTDLSRDLFQLLLVVRNDPSGRIHATVEPAQKSIALSLGCNPGLTSDLEGLWTVAQNLLLHVLKEDLRAHKPHAAQQPTAPTAPTEDKPRAEPATDESKYKAHIQKQLGAIKMPPRAVSYRLQLEDAEEGPRVFPPLGLGPASLGPPVEIPQGLVAGCYRVKVYAPDGSPIALAKPSFVYFLPVKWEEESKGASAASDRIKRMS